MLQVITMKSTAAYVSLCGYPCNGNHMEEYIEINIINDDPTTNYNRKPCHQQI